MLAKEKRRAALSLGIGAALCVAVQARWYWQARLDTPLRNAVDACENDLHPSDPWVDDQKNVICDPNQLIHRLATLPPLPPGFEIGNPKQAQIVRLADSGARLTRDSIDLRGFGVLAVSALPFIWYFLLDRIRELSAAVSGRDREKH